MYPRKVYIFIYTIYGGQRKRFKVCLKYNLNKFNPNAETVAMNSISWHVSVHKSIAYLKLIIIYLKLNKSISSRKIVFTYQTLTATTRIANVPPPIPSTN